MALKLFRAGHLPVFGEWFALPLIELGGCKRIVDPPKGAGEMVALARSFRKQVFLRYEDVPAAT